MTRAKAAKPDAASKELRALLDGRPIVLVGMMGAGKSTVGRRLAARLGLKFIDSDTEIEKAAGMSISDMFETHGEPEFRAGEARVLGAARVGGEPDGERAAADEVGGAREDLGRRHAAGGRLATRSR